MRNRQFVFRIKSWQLVLKNPFDLHHLRIWIDGQYRVQQMVQCSGYELFSLQFIYDLDRLCRGNNLYRMILHQFQ